jgi:hypothetical protein
MNQTHHAAAIRKIDIPSVSLLIVSAICSTLVFYFYLNDSFPLFFLLLTLYLNFKVGQNGIRHFFKWEVPQAIQKEVF